MANVYHLADDQFWYNIERDHHYNGGVYKLFCMYGVEKKPINRLLGTDKDGILYIGQTQCFLSRVIDLKKSISPGYESQNHDAGNRYKANPKIAEMFPYDELYVELFQNGTPEEFEKEQINTYINTFGELPPLNRQ